MEMTENDTAKKLMVLLNTRFSIVPLSKDCVSEAYLQSETYNMIHACMNENLKLTEKELNFSIYKIIRNEASELYFSEEKGQYAKQNNRKQPGEKLLLVFVEHKSGYFSTNSSKLFLELTIDIGVTQEDIDNKTLRYLEYLSSKETLQKFF